MGVSSDGLLCFGVTLPFDEEYEQDFLGHDDWDQFVQKRPEYAALTLVQHCSYECPMWILAVKGTEQRAWRGHVHEVDWNVPGYVRTLFDKFCNEFEIDLTEKPRWLLASNYG